ncbi:xanthine dehydrogenase accessory factor [Pseudomonas sp. BAY1663]|uniref:XdhC family protein n=1 Tax=Pseudomonas sp. BAY1663 TaxID=1439940 RepID=UPI00042DE0A3|nr:XdhC family protein [Pseudomonas sp. BAY1663]EXF46692.1 xanthine dehydrogenase accessory factor [Pseudomonas sp. BAY1663]
MDNVDLDVLRTVLAWRRAGRAVRLYTVVQTWGSAPRQPGSMLALRDDGVVIGSVSGGCIEDDLIRRQAAGLPDEQGAVRLISYGVSREEAARFGLPCGGTLRLAEERIEDSGWVETLVARCAQQLLSVRQLDIASGRSRLGEAGPEDAFAFDGSTLRTVYGPRWRMMLIGAGQVSRYAAEIALLLGFEVLVCDPRSEFSAEWDDGRVTFVAGMPDDAVLDIHPDARTAIVTLTHDPRLDDMALLAALKSEAFYVGALGSKQTTERRRGYLSELGLSPDEIGRLHGPIGLHIGSHAPAEIALSLMAQVVALKNGVAA